MEKSPSIKTLFVTVKPRIIRYDADHDLENAYKFLYYDADYCNHKESLLLVGNQEYSLLDHKDLAKTILDDKDLSEYLYRPAIGAGKFSQGKVIDWGCRGCGITTPDDLRSAILEALGLK